MSGGVELVAASSAAAAASDASAAEEAARRIAAKKVTRIRYAAANDDSSDDDDVPAAGGLAQETDPVVLEATLDAQRLQGEYELLADTANALLQHATAPSHVAIAHAALAQLAMRSFNVVEAERHLDSALAADPTNEDGLYFSAQCALLEDEDEEESTRDEVAALCSLQRIAWRSSGKGADFWIGSGPKNALKKSPFRFQMLVHALLLKSELSFKNQNVSSAAAALADAWELLNSAGDDLPDALTSSIARVAESLPLAFAIGNRPIDALEALRNVIKNPPAAFSKTLVQRVHRHFARVLTRAVSIGAWEACVPKSVCGKSLIEEAFLLLLLQLEEGRDAGTNLSVAFQKQQQLAAGEAVAKHAAEAGAAAAAAGAAAEPENQDGDMQLNPAAVAAAAEEQAMIREKAAARAASRLESSVHAATSEHAQVERELCLALLLSSQLDTAAALFRDAVSLDLDSASMWLKLAFVLEASEKYVEARLAVLESLKLKGDSPTALLLACKLCLNYLGLTQDAADFAWRALHAVEAKRQSLFEGDSDADSDKKQQGNDDSDDEHDHQSVAGISHSSAPGAFSLPALDFAAHVAVGVSSSKLALETSSSAKCQELQSRALSALQGACTSNPGHTGARLALAMLLAEIRQLPDAFAGAKACIADDRANVTAWHLFSLILSAQKRFDDAIQAARAGLAAAAGCPQPLRDQAAEKSLLLFLAQLLVHQQRFGPAMMCFNRLVKMEWHLEDGNAGSGISFVKFHVANSGDDEFVRPRFDATIMRKDSKQSGLGLDAGDSTTALLGVVARSSTKYDSPAALQCDILLSLSRCFAQHAHLFPGSNDSILQDAYDCVFWAHGLGSRSWLPDIHAQLAALCVQALNLGDAVRHFESALAIDPHHVSSLVGLAAIENQTSGGNLNLAYGHLTAAIQVDATSHEAWYERGLALKRQGKMLQCAEHLQTSLELERTAPLVSWLTLSHVM